MLKMTISSVICLTVAVFGLSACSNDINFSEGVAEPKATRTNTDAVVPVTAPASDDAVAKPIEPVVTVPPTSEPTPPLPGDKVIDLLQASLVAKEKASLSLLRAEYKAQTLLEIDDSLALPPGSTFDDVSAMLLWQSDVQDIGKTLRSEFVVYADGNPETVQYAFDVKAAAIDQRQCSYVPPPVIGTIEPVEKWHWDGYQCEAGTAACSEGTRYYITYSSPVVGDLDGDGAIEIVSIPSPTNYTAINGPLVVLNGKTGDVLWNSFQQGGFGALVSTTPAIADLDGDGKAEIISVSMSSAGTHKLDVISYVDRSIKHSYSENFSCEAYCMASVGDIDGDDSPEIIVGNTVLNANATLKFKLAITGTVQKPASVVNIDPDTEGTEIIVGGSAVFAANGTALWKGSCTGYSAAADLDKDDKLEVVCIGGGFVHVYDNKGTARWTKQIPIDAGNPRGGGAPNIGDFTGDGNFEIGTAGGYYYVVYDHSGTELWKSPTVDTSSYQTGSTLFDFNGDGKVEVVYNDQVNLRIYDGAKGTVLWETANASGTLWEYPIIANIDEDAAVEIIVSAPRDGGVRVFEDPTHLWVSSRKLWNQYSYYPELVADNLKIVAKPEVPQSGFRVNSQGTLKQGDKILLSDLTAVVPLFIDDPTVDALDAETSLSIYLFNQGQAVAEKGLTVKIQDGVDVVLLGSAQAAQDIKPGTGILLKIPLTETLNPSNELVLEINSDAQGAYLDRECDTDNNKIRFQLEAVSRTEI